MAFIYDNLIATVIAMTVLLILASIQMDATSRSVANSSRNMAITQAETFGTWMEDELSKVGRNLDEGTSSISTLETEQNDQSPAGIVTTEFVFRYATFEEGSRTVNEVSYRLCDTGTDRTVHTRTGLVSKDLYQLRREGNCSGAGSSEGASPAALGYFHVQRLKANLQPASTPDETQLLRVKYSVIAPFQGEGTVLQEVHRSVVAPFTLEEK